MGKLSENDWDLVLKRIRAGKCTPFLGAGVSAGLLPLGADIATEWATKHGYPFDDQRDLARVAQFYSLKSDGLAPKEELCDHMKKALKPDFTSPSQPHRVLADLDLPIYITTNYDDYMSLALQARQDSPRAPQREICRWNSYIRTYGSFEKPYAGVPTAQKPLVYHLHGHVDSPASLVLAEDDYLDFLVEVNRNVKLVPPRIQEAFAGSSLLFIGYSLTDLTFRVLFRLLVRTMERSLQRINIAVQLKPSPRNGITQEQAEEYLDRYLATNMNVKTYWGTAEQFSAELSQRWKAFNAPPEPMALAAGA